MRQKTLPFILCASIALAIAPVRAQNAPDPSESFLTAFTAYQKGERSEAANNLRGALQAYQEAAGMLDQISKQSPTWNPSIVEFRRKRTADAIRKLQDMIAKQGPAAAPTPAMQPAQNGNFDEGLEPPLPGEDGLIPVFPSGPDAMEAGAEEEVSGGPVSNDPIRQIQMRMDRLQRDLIASRDALDRVTREKEELAQQLEESTSARQQSEEKQKVLQQRADNAESALMTALSEGAAEADTVKILQAERDKTRKELRTLQIEREAAEDVRKQIADRLSSAHKQIATLSSERDAATKLSSEASTRIAEAQKKMEAAITEKNALNEKLVAVVKERDDAVGELKKFKEAQKDLDKLITENSNLMTKLASAEEAISKFKEDGAEKDKTIEGLRKEVGTVQTQLTAAQKESQEFQTQMADLKAKLEGTAKQLNEAKSEGAKGTEEKKKMVDENELLRGIVLRQMKEQARRDQTRKLVLDQMSKLEVKSQNLLSQISYLGEPVVKLTPKERALFKKPQIEISEGEISIAAPISSNDEATSEPEAVATPDAAAPAAPAPAPAAAPKAALPSGVPNGPTSAQPNLPAALMPLVQEAKDHFERKNYRDAEKTYQKILQSEPTNLYALSNLGVVRFQSGKLQLAEDAFKKAIAIAPNDAFSHCTLGIVYYSQEKYDEAMTALTNSLSINPKNATAHNYLGITASQKGWPDAAQKELETATALDPNYADAHFNLAVVFATKQPPNKEDARKYYKRATELGASPDPALETLIK
ncbi:MAG: tetratricopeptide repeat protein [Chthoniobacteraceae bacterium]